LGGGYADHAISIGRYDFLVKRNAGLDYTSRRNSSSSVARRSHFPIIPWCSPRAWMLAHWHSAKARWQRGVWHAVAWWRRGPSRPLLGSGIGAPVVAADFPLGINTGRDEPQDRLLAPLIISR